MNTLRNLVAIGSILLASGCVESERIPDKTTPVVTLDDGSSSLEVRDLGKREERGIQKDELSDPVKIIMESNKKYRDAMAIIGPIVRDLNTRGWDGDAKCHHDPDILAMQENNRNITQRIINDARINGRPEKELIQCFDENEMDADCGKKLISSEMARNLVMEKKGSGEYWQALAACYQEEFKGLPIKKP